jgi:hypothetical protein
MWIFYGAVLNDCYLFICYSASDEVYRERRDGYVVEVTVNLSH